MMGKAKRKKIRKQYVFNGLGFPVVLEDVPMRKIHGEWVPDIRYDRLEEAMAITVALKPGSLTGAEVRFARLRFGMTLDRYAELFGVTRQAVMKWEKTGDESTRMSWPTEKDLRLQLLAREDVDPESFRKAYASFDRKRSGSKRRHRISIQALDHNSKLTKERSKAA